MQDVPAFRSLLAAYFPSPTVRYRQVIHEKVSPVRFGDDQRADNVLVRLLVSDRLYRKSVALFEICRNFVFVGEIAPKLVVAAELQTLQRNVLSATVKCDVQLGFHAFPFLFKTGAFSFQPHDGISLFDFFEIIVLCGQFILPKCDDRNRCMFVPKRILFTFVIPTDIFHPLSVCLKA